MPNQSYLPVVQPPAGHNENPFSNQIKIWFASFFTVAQIKIWFASFVNVALQFLPFFMPFPAIINCILYVLLDLLPLCFYLLVKALNNRIQIRFCFFISVTVTLQILALQILQVFMPFPAIVNCILCAVLQIGFNFYFARTFNMELSSASFGNSVVVSAGMPNLAICPVSLKDHLRQLLMAGRLYLFPEPAGQNIAQLNNQITICLAGLAVALQILQLSKPFPAIFNSFLCMFLQLCFNFYFVNAFSVKLTFQRYFPASVGYSAVFAGIIAFNVVILYSVICTRNSIFTSLIIVVPVSNFLYSAFMIVRGFLF